MSREEQTRYRRYILNRIFLVFVVGWGVLLAGPLSCFATTVGLQWDPVTDQAVAGYKVYYQADSSQQPFTGTGASQGNSPVQVSSQTSATIEGLDPSHAYSFAVTAYYASGVESAYSNIVSVPELVSPTIALTSPANNATVSGTVSVTAGADDNVGVTKVEFYLNGALKVTDTSTPYLYSWDSSAVASGAYTLTARAYDAAGNIGQSGSVSVTVVNDTAPPTVAVTAPASNATVSGTVTISAGASDNVGVTRVEFYDNGALVSATNVAPYSCSWNTTTVANGSHTLSARAYDASNNAGQSANVTVTVNNPDFIVPAVSVTAPANSATVNGTVAVNANASDNMGVARVDFYLNGALLATSLSAPYTYAWNTAQVANGSYTLTAKAYDAAGNVGQSAAVSVTVNNTVADATPPIVTITSPSPGAKVGSRVTISASSTDNVAVVKMQLFLDGVLKATANSGTLKWTWKTSNYLKGAHEIKVTAYDAANNTGSQSITVNR